LVVHSGIRAWEPWQPFGLFGREGTATLLPYGLITWGVTACRTRSYYTTRYYTRGCRRRRRGWGEDLSLQCPTGRSAKSVFIRIHPWASVSCFLISGQAVNGPAESAQGASSALFAIGGLPQTGKHRPSAGKERKRDAFSAPSRLSLAVYGQAKLPGLPAPR